MIPWLTFGTKDSNKNSSSTMLADYPITPQFGRFSRDVHLAQTAKHELLDFIAEELPRWRDDKERPNEKAETELTSQLSSHLNSATHRSTAWSGRIQFSVEETDKINKGRKLDLTAKPCGVSLIIERRRYTHFDVLLPIECKRLPTPQDKKRDKREYVITSPGTTGGIQRFKFGYHASDHSLGAMIAYIQDKTPSFWISEINGWIGELCAEPNSEWLLSDQLEIIANDLEAGLCQLRSEHNRNPSLGNIELRHLWVGMASI